MAPTHDETRAKQRACWLIGLGSVSALGYAALLRLSWPFGEDDVLANEKPTLTMLALFGGLFVAYWCALWLVVRLPPSRRLLGGIFAAACLFRGILLPSIPMHEIDIYRYLWDGAVFADGVSPHHYSPRQVRDAIKAPVPSSDPTLQQLVELQATSQSLSKSLRTIHQEHLPSPYPMVSQVVFAVSAIITPDNSSSHTRLVIMKALLVLMDLATLLVVMLLLHDVAVHPGLSLAYGWCPLLMKEIANGGHLDSIAIFLTTLAISQLVRTSQAMSLIKVRTMLTGFVLALAIGAKLYPVVLLPLFAAVWLRRQGWIAATLGLVTTSLISVALLSPLFGPTDRSQLAQQAKPTQQVSDPFLSEGQLNSPADSTQPSTVDPDKGIQAFLNQWEMNDLVFMLVLENLRQQSNVTPATRPWFVLTSDEWSLGVVTRWAALKQKLRGDAQAAEPAEPLTPSELKAASFSLARALTGGVFFWVACLLAWLAAGHDDPRAWCRTGMLTLAWFWLTCPTQNPWYWCWVLPLLPFARYRTWHLVGALTMLYYLRFWLSAHFVDKCVLGTPYHGENFFYYVIAWVEFVPVFLLLGAEWLRTFGGKTRKAPPF